MHNQEDINILFEDLFSKLCSSDFGTNLGGELPLFIQTIPANMQLEAEHQIERIANRLKKKNIATLHINLYDLCLEILGEADLLDTILEQEAELSKDDIVATIDSVLDIKSAIIPKIKAAISEAKPHHVFISGVGTVFPFVRSHGILNNIDELSKESNLILFFPGEYDNLQLKLFGLISDENYYRGHNINEIN